MQFTRWSAAKAFFSATCNPKKNMSSHEWPSNIQATEVTRRLPDGKPTLVAKTLKFKDLPTHFFFQTWYIKLVGHLWYSSKGIYIYIHIYLILVPTLLRPSWSSKGAPVLLHKEHQRYDHQEPKLLGTSAPAQLTSDLWINYFILQQPK